MQMINRALLTALCVTAFAATALAQRTVRVSVDPSLKAPVQAIAAEFKKIYKDAQVVFVQDAQAVVHLGPPRANLTGTKRLFALDRMVVVAPAEPTRVAKFAHLGLGLKFAALKPTTREGRLGNEIMEQARSMYGLDWWTNAKRNSTVSAGSSDEAVKLVLEGDADAALALSSDATPNVSKLRLIPIPPDIARSVEHFATTSGGSLEQAFVEFLFTKGNQQRLVAAGFASPLSPASELSIAMPGSMMKLFTAALGTYQQETVNGKTGASLRTILSKAKGQIVFLGADGASLSVPMSAITRGGGVIASMPDGNFQVLLPNKPPLRWLRRIESQ